MPDTATDGDELREIARQLEIHAQSYHADTPNERVFMAMSRTILAAAKQLDSTRAIPVGERLPEVDDAVITICAIKLRSQICAEIAEYLLCRGRIQAKRRGSLTSKGQIRITEHDIRDAASTLPLAPGLAPPKDR